MKISGTILGILPSMKNSRTIGQIRRKRSAFRLGHKPYRPILIKSAAARQFVINAMRQINYMQRVGIVVDVSLTVYIYYPNRRHDVDAELLCDVLQKAGVVKNDRQIRVKHFDGTVLDKKNPRIEWEIETLE